MNKEEQKKANHVQTSLETFRENYNDEVCKDVIWYLEFNDFRYGAALSFIEQMGLQKDFSDYFGQCLDNPEVEKRFGIQSVPKEKA